MTSDLNELKNSLIDRASALGRYVDGLRADSARSDAGFGRALAICKYYTTTFVAQVEEDCEADAGDDVRIREILTESSIAFGERERWIDERFARGGQRDVPRALRTLAALEFDRHGLDGLDPVLTVGPPESFETQVASLAEYLLEDLWVDDAASRDAQTGPTDLSIFSIPYIEGTRALWYPIVLGHEIAHVRIERGDAGFVIENLVNGWSRGRTEAFSRTFDERIGSGASTYAAHRRIKDQLFSWATELICDLNAVRLFGPAGLSAIGEFLSLLESTSQRPLLDTESHPPLWLRLSAAFQALDRMGWEAGSLPAFVSVWAGRATPSGPEAQESLFAFQILSDPTNIDSLLDVVFGWHGTTYRRDGRPPIIDYVCRELLDGIPGATHAATDDGWQQVTVADVVNAAWSARDALAAPGARSQESVLMRSGLSAQERRLRIDSLASKAIDTLDLQRLWGRDQGIISPGEVESPRPLDPTVAAAPARRPIPQGVVSRTTLTRLLRAGQGENRRERLVVSPLFTSTVQDAALDLRLGPDFIVFRHSSIRAFNPIAEEQDPRTMQERVHKAWGEPFVLHPQELVLASTLEYIVLPDTVAAQVLTRSSYGRLGLLTATAVQVQPGSRGCITLELVNQSDTPIELYPAARVAQLMMWTIGEPAKAAPEKYLFPVGPEFSKVTADQDRPQLRGLTEPRPTPPATLEMRFEGGGSLIQSLRETARAHGIPEADMTTLSDDSQTRRLAAGEVLVIGLVICASARSLATTVQRWVQSMSRGVVITMVDGQPVSTVDPNLPRGTIVVADENGITVSTLMMPSNTVTELTSALRALVSRSRTA